MVNLTIVMADFARSPGLCQGKLREAAIQLERKNWRKSPLDCFATLAEAVRMAGE